MLCSKPIHFHRSAHPQAAVRTLRLLRIPSAVAKTTKASLSHSPSVVAFLQAIGSPKMSRSCSTWVCILLIWSATAMRGEGAPVAAPAPSLDCTSVLSDLFDCLSYAQNGSTVTKPTAQCCSGLKKVVKGKVGCLCDAFKEGASLVNITKALTLPSACGVSTPAVTKCNIAIPGAPAMAPVPSSSGASPFTFHVTPSPSPGKSTAAAIPVPFLWFFGSILVTLWLHYQRGLEF